MEDFKEMISSASIGELRKIAERLFIEYFDARRTLDEQLIVNEKMYSNHYLYEARVCEARAKLLYAKAEIMIRN